MSILNSFGVGVGVGSLTGTIAGPVGVVTKRITDAGPLNPLAEHIALLVVKLGYFEINNIPLIEDASMKGLIGGLHHKVTSLINQNKQINSAALKGLLNEMVAPVIEEAIFRMGVPGAVKHALMTCFGVPEDLASALGQIVGNVLFVSAHGDGNRDVITATALVGMSCSFMQEKYGLSGAISTHLFSNLASGFIGSPIANRVRDLFYERIHTEQRPSELKEQLHEKMID